MPPAWVQNLLRPAGLVARSLLAGPGGRCAAICCKLDPLRGEAAAATRPPPTRIVAIQEGSRVPEQGEILGVYAHSPPVELFTQASGVLLAGTQVLYTSRGMNRPTVARLDLDSLEFDANFYRPRRAEFFGLDVDPTGRYGLIAWRAHPDFPSITVYDADRDRLFELECGDLVGARLADVRWNWPKGIRCHNLVEGCEVSLPVDFEEMRIAWEPRRVIEYDPPPFDPFGMSQALTTRRYD